MKVGNDVGDLSNRWRGGVGAPDLPYRGFVKA